MRNKTICCLLVLCPTARPVYSHETAKPQKFGQTESLGVSPEQVTGWGKTLKAAADDTGFVPIFDGKSLSGWDGDPKYWRVENGRIVGEVTEETILQRNSFLIWRGGKPGDFELMVEYRVTPQGNSGINYRSVQLSDAPWSLAGYQADIDGARHDLRPPRRRYTGQAYEERGRRFLALRGQVVRIGAGASPVLLGTIDDADVLEKAINDEGWNRYHLVIKGNTLAHFLNGRLMSLVFDEDLKNRRKNGLIGVQVHTGPPHKIEYRKLLLKILDSPR